MSVTYVIAKRACGRSIHSMVTRFPCPMQATYRLLIQDLATAKRRKIVKHGKWSLPVAPHTGMLIQLPGVSTVAEVSSAVWVPDSNEVVLNFEGKGLAEDADTILREVEKAGWVEEYL